MQTLRRDTRLLSRRAEFSAKHIDVSVVRLASCFAIARYAKRKIQTQSDITASATASQAELYVVPAPPPEFDWRSCVTSQTRQVVGTLHPELQDLVDDGTLVVWQRPADYVERRQDGYLEPEILYLVGTAHVSQKSAVDVTRVINAVHPDAVVVELCRSRTAIMAEPDNTASDPQQPFQTVLQPTTSANGSIRGVVSLQSASALENTPNSQSSDEDTVDADYPPTATSAVGQPASTGGQHTQQEGSSPSSSTNGGQVAATSGAGVLSLAGSSGGPAGFMAAMQRSAMLGGQSGFILRLLLAGLARRTAGALGVQGGAEFLAARRAAEKLEAQLVLGDRPVEITLQRAWQALSGSQRLQLCWQLGLAAVVAPPKELSAELVERLKRDDALSSLMAGLASQYPCLLGPLVHERDAYLAWSLKRSKAVNGVRCVVGVLGAGHMKGVVYALATDKGGDTLRFSELVGNMNKRTEKRKQLTAALTRFGVELALGTAAYAGWLYWQGQGL